MTLTRPSHIARTALGGAALLLAALLLEWYLVFHVGFVGRLDASIYHGFLGLSVHAHVTAAATAIASLCNPDPFVFLAAIPVLAALARRRPLIAAAIVLILAGANLTTEALKPLLAAVRPGGLPGWQVLPGSWPSGHATASMSLALCAVLAAPARWRPFVAALGAGFAIAVCYSFLTLGWHYPSDALAGLLVASIWTLIAVAGVSVIDGRRGTAARRAFARPAPGHALVPSALAAGAVVVLAALAAGLHPAAVGDYARAHRAFVAGALALGAVAMSVPAGVMLTIRRR